MTNFSEVGAAGNMESRPPQPQILLRTPGKLELFQGPSKDGNETQELTIEDGFPEVEASSTEWSK